MSATRDLTEQTRSAALAAHMNGALGDAETLYRKVLAASPRDAQSLTMYGVLAAQTGRAALAIDLLQRAMEADPRQPLAPNNLGIVLTGLGRFEAAVSMFDKAISVAPEYADAYSNRAIALVHQRRHEEALRSCDSAIRLQPSVPLLATRATILYELGRFDEALRGYENALLQDPGYTPALNGAAAALSALLRPEESRQRSELAIAADPEAADGYINLAIALEDLGRYPEALASIERASMRSPRDARAYHNGAAILMQLERFDEALDSFDRAIALQPNDSRIRFAKGACLLLLGRFSEGWPLYESRLIGPQATKDMRPLCVALPRWNGTDSLQGRTIFVHWEQGLGDTIQFCRLAQELIAKGASVILEVQPALARLLRSLSPSIRVATDPSAAAQADCYVPLLSLPGALGFQGDLSAHAVAHVPYVTAESERAEHWAQRIGNHGFRVGISWQGSHRKLDFGRSFPAHFLGNLTNVPGVRLISLQKHDGLNQLAQLPLPTSVETLGPDFDAGSDAFLDTAAVIDQLDLVITSDTSIAHLAGAMGRETWVVLRRVPDWRWLLEREDSPWYPSMRLFRQRRNGDWGETFERVEAALRQRVG